jgi:serine/threonine protein kinase
MDTGEVVARFESERQALALMSHPSIASIFDGGATEDGRPYFAMELVRGEPLTEYCDKNRLTVRERLRLFLQVCEGVQHAHQKGVIHRDLKPSNILVTIRDEKPVPKIIDFGVAKATSQRLTEKTLYTQLGQWVGTPVYMSPEQAEMTGIDVDTRTDVYSLGVVLYEQGDFSSAERRFRESLSALERIVDRPNQGSAYFASGLAMTLVSLEKYQEAAAQFERALEIDPALVKLLQVDPDSYTVRSQRSGRLSIAYGRLLVHQGRYEDAEFLLLSVLGALERDVPPDDTRTRRTRAFLVELYDAWGRPEKAAVYREPVDLTPGR